MSLYIQYDFQKNIGLEGTLNFFDDLISEKYPPDQLVKINKALQMSADNHQGQFRSDGSPYLIHPVRVALLLEKYEPTTTVNMVVAALLHDALEDTELSEEEVDLFFGEPTLTYLRGVTRYRVKGETSEQRKAGKKEKWSLTMKSPEEIRLIKTFDYLDNMISWKFIASDQVGAKKIPRWLMEAKTMYIPLAEITNAKALRLMKEEFEFYIHKGHEIGNWYSG